MESRACDESAWEVGPGLLWNGKSGGLACDGLAGRIRDGRGRRHVGNGRYRTG